MSTEPADGDPPDPAGGEGEPAPLTPLVRPGDLAALEATALAAARQWVALAAWARREGQDPRSADALRQLATHADDPAAFTWMWSLVTDRPTRANWQSTAAMPEQVAVPGGLLAEVAAELAAPPSDDAVRNVAREAIMARQHPTTPGAIELATAVLDPDADVVPEVGEEAARVLGGSTDRDARDTLIIAAEASPWLQKAQMLARLQPPLDESEVAAFLAVVDERRRHLSINVGAGDPYRTRVQQLVAALPAPARLTVLADEWLDQPGYAVLLLTGPVMQALGAEHDTEIGQLLELAATDDIPEPVVQAVLAQLHTLSESGAVEMAECAHQLLGPERAAAARRHYVEQAERYRNTQLSGRDRFRHQALAALARMALTEPPTPGDLLPAAALERDGALGDYAQALGPGETSQLEVAAMSGGQLRRLGAVLGLRLRGDLPHQPGDEDQQRQAATADTLAILDALVAPGEGDRATPGGSAGDAACAQVLAGLVTLAVGLVTKEMVVVALLAGPESTAVIARAAPAPTAAILHALPERWPASRTLDLLEAIPTDAAVQAVEELAGALEWTALEASGDLPRAADALARHPRLLAAAVRTAVKSQIGSSAKSASLARVVALVRTLIHESHVPTGVGMLPEQLPDTAALIEVLVDSSRDELDEVAGHWLSRCTPTEELTALVIRADNTTIAEPSPYRSARTAMAERLCARARDGDGDPGDEARIDALEAARRLDPGQARTIAMDLIETSDRPLRRAAAGVIQATSANPGEGDRLSALIANQRDRDTFELLKRAHQSMTSGSTGEALTNAVDLVGARDSFGDLDPDICLPHEKQVWHEVFRQRVDQARASTSDTPENRANTLVLLADLLAEQAIATHWIASGKPGPAAKAQQILTRAKNKPQSGNLAREQQLHHELPLVRSWAGMRELRTGHHAPLDGAIPVPVTEQDAQAALTALRRIFEGWVQTMYAFARQPPPPAAAR